MSKQVVLAFSGGLDTCWCVPYLIDRGYEVITATVDVGGFSQSELDVLKERSKALGAVEHLHIHAKQALFDQALKHLIAGNVLRGNLYPLCVGVERTLQAQESAKAAKKLGAQAVAHGCTAAGNDQIRFEVALRATAPDLEILAPVRDDAPKREDQVAYLQARNLPIPSHGSAYSVNSGIWGITIGGAETTGTELSIPEDQWVRTKGAFDHPKPPIKLNLEFTNGVPSALNGEAMSAVDLVEKLDGIAASYGIGRGIHLGETILGIKGRVAFEAPAPTVILTAHRELEKLVLTKRQIALKDQLAASYGDMVHEGLLLEPACRDIEAFFTASQSRVTGTVHLLLRPGSVFVEGVTSAYSLHAASRAVYGEAVGEWTPEDAKGFGRIYGLPTILAARVGGDI